MFTPAIFSIASTGDALLPAASLFWLVVRSLCAANRLLRAGTALHHRPPQLLLLDALLLCALLPWHLLTPGSSAALVWLAGRWRQIRVRLAHPPLQASAGSWPPGSPRACPAERHPRRAHVPGAQAGQDAAQGLHHHLQRVSQVQARQEAPAGAGRGRGGQPRPWALHPAAGSGSLCVLQPPWG